MNKQTIGKFDQNASRKKSIVVFLLTAALLVSMVGMASASSVTWYPTDNSTSVPGVADYWMTRGERSGQTGTFHWIQSGESKLWIANESAEVDCTFCGTADWRVVLDYSGEGEGGWLDAGETLTVKIGTFNTGTGFTEKCSESQSGGEMGWMLFKTCPEFTVLEGDYLAFQILMADGSAVKLDQSGTNTNLRSPVCGDPYPVPELPTIILMSTGLLALLGYAVYRRRNNKLK